MAYVDGSFAFGVLSEGPAPTVVNAPDGARIKLRFRADEITRAFVRHANGDFTVWSLDWVDQKARTMKLQYPQAANIRTPHFRSNHQPTKTMTAPAPLSPEDLSNRFAYHSPTGGKAAKHGAMREKCHQLAAELTATVPPGRELSTAITKLEEVMMWANAGIARHAEVQLPESAPGA